MSAAIALDARLSAIMDLVPPGGVVADIGADHGYLICQLVKKGVAKRGFACEINPGPLKRAMKAISENCLSDKIDAVLTDGLHGLPYREIDVFVIAGMGGDLIAKILLEHTWARDSRFSFVLQPMTKPERLRKALCKNGFGIVSESPVMSVNRVYTVMRVQYTGVTSQTDDTGFYTGRIPEHGGLIAKLYLEQAACRVEKRAKGLLKSRYPEKAMEYERLAAGIRKVIRGMNA